MNNTAVDHHPAFTVISFDDLCQTLYEAVEGVSGDTLLSQYDTGESCSYARISRLRDTYGNTYALIQLEGYAARTIDDTSSSVEQAVLALIEARGGRSAQLNAALKALSSYADAGSKVTLH